MGLNIIFLKVKKKKKPLHSLIVSYIYSVYVLFNVLCDLFLYS